MAGKYRRGNAWYLNWVEDGTQKHRSLGAVTEAEAEAARLAKQQSLGASAAAGPAFADWAIRYATWHAEQYPDSYYRVEQILRCYLIPAFGPIPLLALNRELVEGYKRTRMAAAAAGTVIKELRTLKACLNQAVAWEIIPRNPIAHVPAPKDLTSRPPRWYNRDELARIYAAELIIPKCTTREDAELHRRFRWCWQLLANTGLRRGEAMHLQWRDVGAREIAVRSEPDARTKSGKWRSVPITRGAQEALESITATRAGHVLPEIAPASISRAFSRTLTRSNLDGSIHCLRHTYCSHLVQAGVPLRTVQVLAGHASYTTTERYAHLAPSAIRDSIAQLDI